MSEAVGAMCHNEGAYPCEMGETRYPPGVVLPGSLGNEPHQHRFVLYAWCSGTEFSGDVKLFIQTQSGFIGL